MWTNQLGKQITLDLGVVKRSLRESKQVTGPIAPSQSTHTSSTTATSTPHGSYTAPPTFPPPPPYFMAQDTPTHLTTTQYSTITDQLSFIFRRMDNTDLTLNKILAALNPPAYVNHDVLTESIVSAITSTIISESELTRSHQLSTSTLHQSQIMTPLTQTSQTIQTQTSLLHRHLDATAASQQATLHSTNQAKTLLTTTITEVESIRCDVSKMLKVLSTSPTPTRTDSPPPD
jgi:hypothetical protein